MHGVCMVHAWLYLLMPDYIVHVPCMVIPVDARSMHGNSIPCMVPRLEAIIANALYQDNLLERVMRFHLLIRFASYYRAGFMLLADI